jgi:hypothetical protein
MKFVKVNKVKLSETTLSAAILYDDDVSPAEFFQMFDAPAKFELTKAPFLNDGDTPAYPTKVLSILGVWYLRGTAITFPNGQTLQTNNPHPEYRYSFVDNLPEFYIKRGATSTDKAYKLGQELIAKAIKASQLYTEKTIMLEHPITKEPIQETLRDYSRLEAAYKKIARALLDSRLYNRYSKAYFESPNTKTWTEVFAERNLDAELEAICEVSVQAKNARQKYTDEEIAFYSRVFGLEMPEYFLRYRYSKKRHGYAVIPVLDTKAYATMSFDGKDNRMYAANLGEYGDIEILPYTLQIDGLPRRLDNIDTINYTKNAEAIDFFLSLPKQEMVTFIADGYGYCFKCKSFYEEAEGCPCHAHKDRDTEEFIAILSRPRSTPSRICTK